MAFGMSPLSPSQFCLDGLQKSWQNKVWITQTVASWTLLLPEGSTMSERANGIYITCHSPFGWLPTMRAFLICPQVPQDLCQQKWLGFWAPHSLQPLLSSPFTQYWLLITLASYFIGSVEKAKACFILSCSVVSFFLTVSGDPWK